MANSLIDARTQANNFGLFIGVGQRPDDPDTFKVTAEDATKLSKALQKGFNLIPEANNFLLIDEEANRDKIFEKLEGLKQISKNKKIDTVWIYFSGHGYFDQNEFYLITNGSTTDNYTEKAMKGSLFSQYLKQVQCEKMLVVLDCCHSGGFNGMENENDLPHGIYPEFFKDTPNRIILSACGRGQVSYLTRPISLFTYALIETLGGKFLEKEDNEIKLFSLAMGVRERVTYLSGKLFSDGRPVQKPELDVLKDSKTENFSLQVFGKPGAQEVRFLKEEITSITSENNSKTINASLLANDMETIMDEDAREKLAWLKVNININQNYGMVIGTQINVGLANIREEIKNILIKNWVNQYNPEVLEKLEIQINRKNDEYEKNRKAIM